MHQCNSECEPFSAEPRCVEAWARDACGSIVEVSGTGVHVLEHRDTWRQEGGLPYTSVIVDLSNPLTNINTPRVVTPDTQGSESAPLASHLGRRFRSIVDELFKLTDSAQKNHGGDDNSCRVFEELLDEHILERAERTGQLETIRQEPGIVSPQVAGPESGTRESRSTSSPS